MNNSRVGLTCFVNKATECVEYSGGAERKKNFFSYEAQYLLERKSKSVNIYTPVFHEFIMLDHAWIATLLNSDKDHW